MFLIALSLLLLLPWGAAHASGNLLVNGDAETGDITGWTASSPQFRAITPAQGFPVYEGNWSFSAGPAGGESVMYQDIDLTSLASCIDSGACSFEFTGWSRTDDADSARVLVLFSGRLSLDTGYFSSPPGWHPHLANGIIPAGARTVTIFLYGKGPHRFWINVYFDLLSLTVAPSTASSSTSWGRMKSMYR